MLPFFVMRDGAIANRLCPGLQIQLAQFDSGSRLQKYRLNFDYKNLVKSFDKVFYIRFACPSGEIGRHIGLKIRRFVNNGHTGSIPVSGTISYFRLYQNLKTRVASSYAGFLLPQRGNVKVLTCSKVLFKEIPQHGID